ncbi:glycosyltransferase family 61 protein [Methylobacterium sp. JK268]
MQRALRRISDLWGEARILTEPPRLRTVRNARYLPLAQGGAWGVFDADRRIVEESVDYVGPERHLPHQIVDWPADMPDPVEEAPEEHYLYVGQINPHYGHFIINTLARFWPLLDAAGARMPILCHGPVEAHGRLSSPAFVATILERLGLRLADLTVFDRPVRVRRVTVIAPALRELAWAHPRMAALGEVIGRTSLEGVPVDADDRPVYLSKARVAAYVQRVENEEDMAEALSRAGVDVVHPETLSFDEQVRLFARRRTVISCIGSALHTALFAPPGRSLIVITPFSRINATYVLVDAIKKNNARYYHPRRVIHDRSDVRETFSFAEPARIADELILRMAHPEVSERWDELDGRATWHQSPIPPLPPRLTRRNYLSFFGGLLDLWKSTQI